MVAVIGRRHPVGTATLPSGWSSVADVAIPTTPTDDALWVFYKVATATEPASYSFEWTTTAGKTGILADWVGPFSAPVVKATGTNSSNVTTSSPTVSVDATGGTLIWAVATAYHLSAVTPPSGFTALVDLHTNSTLEMAQGPVTSGIYAYSGAFGTPSRYAAVGVAVVPLTAPAAPSLDTPTNGSSVAAGIRLLKSTYRSTDGYAANAYALELKTTTAGTFSYWNASTSALQSTVVWNTCSVVTGTTFGVTLPSTLFTAGKSYQWSMAYQESGANLQGPFATPFVFTVRNPATVSVTAPTGTITTSRPLVAWTATAGSGSSLTKYRVVIYTTAQAHVSGFTPGTSPSTYDSGTRTGTTSSLVVPVTLSSATYLAYVQVTETGTLKSTWAFTTFTLSQEVPITPTVSVVATTTSSTQYPVLQITVHTHDNLLGATTASPKTSVGTWVATTNCTIASVVPPVSVPDGPDGALKLTPTAAGTETVRTAEGVTGFAVQPSTAYTFQASFLSGTLARSCKVQVRWFTSAGVLISSTTSAAHTDNKTTWTAVVTHVTSPATAALATLRLFVATASATTDLHYVAMAAVIPGTVTTWGAGGFVGNTTLKVTRSDGLYLRGASTLNRASVPTSQVLVLTDYECVPTVDYHYSVVEIATATNANSLAAVTGTATVSVTGWWETDPTDPTRATHAQVTQWSPVQTEASAAHMVMGQTTMNVVANTVLNQDFAATFWIGTATTYAALVALAKSQRVIFIQSPFGPLDSGYFKIAPQSGGLSAGVGNKTRTVQLLASTSSKPVRTVQMTAVAQPRPVP
jgi:hypothetical protein